MSIKVKIINDPVYGFIRFPERELMQLIDHAWFQRLRHIKQMGLAHLVYPGATHTRFHHSLGACHLMGKALDELQTKGVVISEEDRLAARIAALLHDVGHAPFSHSLEHTLVGISHEKISRLVMQKMDTETGGMLGRAMQIFDNACPQKYLNQLVSGQLDVDRMDYLNRDSFYTGVSEGVIGYDRILQMLTVRDNELAVEEKGVYSIEKFIIARYIMYWQVYLHKTVLSAELLLINILKRAKQLAGQGKELFATPALSYFLYRNISEKAFINEPEHLNQFCMLDDNDIMVSIKVWQTHEDKVLSTLCKMLILRKLYKVVYNPGSLARNLRQKKDEVKSALKIDDELIEYFVFSGVATNRSYHTSGDVIKIETKEAGVKKITEMEDSLVNQTLAHDIQKKYICFVPF